jgi:hypothetical protein
MIHSAVNIATILEQSTQATIEAWLGRVELEPFVSGVLLSPSARCAYLPQLFRDLVFRLRNPLPFGARALVSSSAASHGILRREQGYSAAMMVEESRMLQVSIFETLQNNRFRIDFTLLLAGVMTIADEVDSQLGQAIASYLSSPRGS